MISKWITVADTKAQILIGIQLFIIGFVSEKHIPIDCFEWMINILFLVFLFISCISLFDLYRVIKSRLSNKTYGSKIYFRDIAKSFELNAEETKDLIKNEKKEDFLSDLTDQIIILSGIANEKYKDLEKAEKFMIISFILGLVLYLMNIS